MDPLADWRPFWIEGELSFNFGCQFWGIFSSCEGLFGFYCKLNDTQRGQIFVL